MIHVGFIWYHRCDVRNFIYPPRGATANCCGWNLSLLYASGPLQTDGTHEFPTGAHSHLKPYTLQQTGYHANQKKKKQNKRKQKKLPITAILLKAHQIKSSNFGSFPRMLGPKCRDFSHTLGITQHYHKVKTYIRCTIFCYGSDSGRNGLSCTKEQ